MGLQGFQHTLIYVADVPLTIDSDQDLLVVVVSGQWECLLLVDAKPLPNNFFRVVVPLDEI